MNHQKKKLRIRNNYWLAGTNLIVDEKESGGSLTQTVDCPL